MKVSKDCKFGPKAFHEHLRRELNERIYQFFEETKDVARTREGWMKEFFFWSRNNMWEKEEVYHTK